MKKSFLKFFGNKSEAFTLVEVLISVFIVILLTTMVLVNFEWGGYNFALERSLRAISQQIRLVQEMALSSKEIEGAVPPGGYGIHFAKTDLQKYILFADYKNTEEKLRTYGLEDQIIGEYSLERDISIEDLCESYACEQDFLDIVFVPPDPEVYINGFPSPGGSDFFAKIFLVSVNKATGSIAINGAGLVEVQK